MTRLSSMNSSTYSEMRREDAVRSIALRQRIEATGDTDLMRLMEERDYLWMNHEEGREIRAEWAAQARRLVDALAPDAQHGCACDICAITHGLDAAVSAYGVLADRSKVERAIGGAIKSAVDSHGPITRANYSGAAKRIYSALKAVLRGDA